MLDAIVCEKAGVPAAAIITEPFRATCDAVAEIARMPGYRFAVVGHPVTSLDEAGLRARADAATPFVEALLVDGVAWPSAAPAGDVSSLVDVLAEGLRADGADLSGTLAGDRLDLRLHVPDEACAECIMPRDHLVAVFERQAREHLGRLVAVVLEDPREG